MPRLLTIARFWRLIREIDLEALRREAETVPRLLIAGASAPAREIAERLVSPLPWSHLDPAIRIVPAADVPSLMSDAAFEAALLVSRDHIASDIPVDERSETTSDGGALLSTEEEIAAAEERALRALRAMHVPTLAISVGSAAAHERSFALRRARRGSGAPLHIDRIDGATADSIGRALLGLLPVNRRLAFGRHFPSLREPVFAELVDETARANASYSFGTGLAEIVPVLNIAMNMADILVLTKNQLVMSYKIALVAGKDGRPRDVVGEVLGVLGGGLLFRQVARQLIGLVPAIGIVPKVAVAYGGTWAIGRAVVLWATEGQAVTVETVRTFSKEGLERGRQVARAIARRSASTEQLAEGPEK